MSDVLIHDGMMDILDKAEELGWEDDAPSSAEEGWTPEVADSTSLEAEMYLEKRDWICASVEEASEAFEEFICYRVAPGDDDVKGAIRERMLNLEEATPGLSPDCPDERTSALRNIYLVWEYYRTRL